MPPDEQVKAVLDSQLTLVLRFNTRSRVADGYG